MLVRLTPYQANMIAQNVDYNYNGIVEYKELKFKDGCRWTVDANRDNIVTRDELAESLMRGDIFITQDRKAYPNYQPYPGHFPGSIFPPYGPGMPNHYNPAPYPGSYNPAPYPQGPGYPYTHGYARSTDGVGDAFASTVVGAGAGAMVGAVVGGREAAGTGAIVGGALGFMSSLFH